MSKNTGALYENNDYVEGSRRPKYKGKCEIDGKDFNMFAWIKTSKNGKKYFFFTFDDANGINNTKPKLQTIKKDNVVHDDEWKIKHGLRPLSIIPEGKKVEKVKTEDMDATGVPF